MEIKPKYDLSTLGGRDAFLREFPPTELLDIAYGQINAALNIINMLRLAQGELDYDSPTALGEAEVLLEESLDIVSEELEILEMDEGT